MSTGPEFSKAEIETGRRLFSGEWKFLTAAGSLASLSRTHGLEIAFAGRSNVGKSSLINALTGRGALARTSKKPGRTQQLIFFSGPGLMLVDLPGYGYAVAAKSTVSAWTKLVQEYLGSRAMLARVYLLVDARQGLKKADEAILDTLELSAVSHEIVLTKCDQISMVEVTERLTSVQAAIGTRSAAFPEALATSARTGFGIPQLRAAISRLMRERHAFAAH